MRKYVTVVYSSKIPDYLDYPPKRGTPAWEDREDLRAAHGCVCMSYGAIKASEKTPSLAKERSIYH